MYYFCGNIKNMKKLIQELVSQNLSNFEVAPGSEQRSIGDLIEYKVQEIIINSNSHDLIKETLLPRSKKSIEDVSVIDSNGIHHYVDTKSHNINSNFSMPNLSSVEKLRKLLLDDDKTLIYVFVSYCVDSNMVSIQSIDVKYVWELNFSMLRIGSLGKGQLQISDMNKSLIFTDEGKDSWFNRLKTTVNQYHDERIKQIEKDKKIWQ